MASLRLNTRFSRIGYTLLIVSALCASLTLLEITRSAFPIPKGYSRPENPEPTNDGHTRGAVASVSDVCSRAGIGILRIGGNAADAAVATEFCLGVNTMWITGLGAGGFAVVRDPKTKIIECVDFRETAPAAAFVDMFVTDAHAAVVGANASGVPGEVRGLEYIHRRYGKLSWPEVVQPSIDLARYGFKVTELMETAMHNLVGDDTKDDFFVNDPAWAKDFAPGGYRVKAGQNMTRKAYADLLDRIAKEGADVFHHGSAADATINALASAGGIMTRSDLRDYSIVTTPAIEVKYRDYTIHACGAPSGGSIVNMVMNIMQGYTGVNDTNAINQTTHRLNEAIRFGYGQRTKLGDPALDSDQSSIESQILSPSYAADIRSRISDDHTLSVEAYNPDHLLSRANHGTSHMAAADADGMAVSLTSTVNLHFGSRLMVPETGVIMNNEMDDFSIPGTTNSFGLIPSPANYIHPKKRPLSSMSPVLILRQLNQGFYAAVGAAGGSRIITAVIENIWKLIDLGMSPEDAVASPRFHDQLTPDQTIFEASYDPGVVSYMQARGHKTIIGGAGTDVHVLRQLSNGIFEAAAEPREPGSGGFTI